MIYICYLLPENLSSVCLAITRTDVYARSDNTYNISNDISTYLG